MAVTRVIPMSAREPQPDRIAQAAEVLRQGGLVAFPTETVYGLGANALDSAAVDKIFEAKGRPSTDPLIVHLASSAQLEIVAARVPPMARVLAAAFWPGALTIVLEKQSAVPSAVTAGLSTVAVRVPSHPVALALIAAADVPVAAPSANRFSRPSPTRAEHVLADLDGRIDLLIDAGPTVIGVESTIVDLTSQPPIVRRPGGVPLQTLARVIPDVQLGTQVASEREAQSSPGQLLRHYAPYARMTLFVGPTDAITGRVADAIRQAVAAGARVGVLAPQEDLLALAPRLAAIGRTGRVVTARCGSRVDREEAARDLFGALRALDDQGVDLIYATVPEGNGINTAIVDRLTRASEGRVHRVIG
jgi:L-threonylcarbamoyladenylate synthase